MVGTLVVLRVVTGPVPRKAELKIDCWRMADRSACAKGGCCVAPVPGFKHDASATGKAPVLVPALAIALPEVGGRATPCVLACCPLSFGRAIVDRKS